MNGIGGFDRNQYLSRSEICDFLTRMTGKVITPELVTAWCKGTMTRKYNAVKYNGVYYLPDKEVVRIMHDIRKGEQLVTISSEKEDISLRRNSTHLDVVVSLRVVKEYAAKVEKHIEPLHYLEFIRRVKEGARIDEI
jgi:uncharacterized phage-associated protein|tara:strand:+ start:51 stop:461 length:411 start_codon:yes stop_codon:yes gene_type:complete